MPELLDKEKEVIGIYLRAHPLDGYKFEMDNYGFLPITELEKSRGRVVRLAGFVTDTVHAVTKKGSKFGKLVLNDYSGNQEIVFWENNYVQYNNFIDNGQKLMIQGVYAEHKYRPGVMEFQIQNIMLLDNVRKAMTKRLHLLLPLALLTDEFVDFIYSNVKKYPGNTEFTFQVVDEEKQRIARLKSHNIKLELNDELIQFLLETEGIKYSLELSN